MEIEIRADGIKISGYVNVVGRASRPVMTPHGKVVEEIEEGAFSRALERAGDIAMTKDHLPLPVLALRSEGNLALKEDNIGLHYVADITDPQTIEEAKAGKIRGLSFGMRNIVDEVEERVGQLPLRKIRDLDLDHVTLVVHKIPVYSATSLEVRAEGETELEMRGNEDAPNIESRKADNSAFQARIDKLKN